MNYLNSFPYDDNDDNDEMMVRENYYSHVCFVFLLVVTHVFVLTTKLNALTFLL